MQGVSINLFIKTGKKKANELGKVFHYDLFGKREFKYDFLLQNSLKTINYIELPNVAPMYYMVQKDLELGDRYSEGFSLNLLFNVCLLGPNSHRDGFAIAFDQNDAQCRIDDFVNPYIEIDTLRRKYDLKDNRDWQLEIARKNKFIRKTN